MIHNNYYTQVAIIGAGISGSSLLFLLSKYTNIDSISIFEKYNSASTLNSSAKANSQTLHMGDIETNYNFEKAKKVKASSSMVANFINKLTYDEKIAFRRTKMVLAVGGKEIEELKQRYEQFKSLYPYLELWDKSILEKIEPILLEQRNQPILAMGAHGMITTVDYGKLSNTFLTHAEKESPSLSTYFNTKVMRISRKWGNFLIHTNQGEYMAKFVVVNAGAHSLLLAQEMNYAEDYSMLPIGGSFYFAKKEMLKAKVYTMQNPKLPFAAVHGDPDLTSSWKTRFGPTAFAMPKLERYQNIDIAEVIDALSLDGSVLNVYKNLMADKEIRAYILRNLKHELPGIGNQYFIKEVQKIIPSLNSNEIFYAKGYGGMRPQIIDKKNRSLLLGEAKIDTQEGIIFNMTPSPGASSCLGNALEDAKILCKYLKKNLQERRIKKDLCDQREHCYLN